VHIYLNYSLWQHSVNQFTNKFSWKSQSVTDAVYHHTILSAPQALKKGRLTVKGRLGNIDQKKKKKEKKKRKQNKRKKIKKKTACI